jgi:hypothetical protein
MNIRGWAEKCGGGGEKGMMMMMMMMMMVRDASSTCNVLSRRCASDEES